MFQPYCTDAEARRMILDAGRRMFERNFVASNDGNISCRVGENSIWVTPTNVSKGYMTEDMLIRVDLDGNVLEGNRKPSSELKMHLRVYRENPEARGVAHAHPLVATTFAIARIPLDVAILPEGVVQLGVVPVAEYATTGSQGVPDSIAPYCRDYNAVLLANHGALTWGTDVMQAYYRMESLECYATIMMYSGYLNGPARVLGREQVKELVAVRESIGIRTGGMPRCAEDFLRAAQ